MILLTTISAERARKGKVHTYDITNNTPHLHHHEPIHILEGKFHNAFLVYYQHPVKTNRLAKSKCYNECVFHKYLWLTITLFLIVDSKYACHNLTSTFKYFCLSTWEVSIYAFPLVLPSFLALTILPIPTHSPPPFSLSLSLSISPQPKN